MDRAFFLTLHAIRRQLAAMPCQFYLIRLIHHLTRKAFPGDRLWSAPQVTYGPTVRFLRARNREGFDVYFRPDALNQNAGYILLDLDHAEPAVLHTMRANGHQPCAVIETSPGHLQAWIQVCAQPLQPAVATEIGRHLARLYQGDRASTDWHHLGRLAGFTNQKPKRRLPTGWPPWIKLRHATPGLASHGPSLVEAASRRVVLAATLSTPPPLADSPSHAHAASPSGDPPAKLLTRDDLAAIYQTWLNRLRIPQRFHHPDWSIADLWIAKELLLRGTPAAEVKTILRFASPHFPRRHADPDDYLRRTLARATGEIQSATFPARDAASLPFRIHPRNPNHCP